MVLSWRRKDWGWMSGGSSLLWVLRCWNRLPREVVDAPSIPGGVQGQVGWGPGQPGLVLNVEVGGPACGRGVGDSWSLRSLPTQAIPCVILWSLIMTIPCAFMLKKITYWLIGSTRPPFHHLHVHKRITAKSSRLNLITQRVWTLFLLSEVQPFDDRQSRGLDLFFKWKLST